MPPSLPSSDRSLRRRPTQARSRALVNHVLDAAEVLLAEEGWHRFSTNAAARRAGVSVSSLYRYFPDRVAIVWALGERLRFRYREVVVNNPDDGLDGVIGRVVAGLDGVYREHPAAAILTRELIPEAELAFVGEELVGELVRLTDRILAAREIEPDAGRRRLVAELWVELMTAGLARADVATDHRRGVLVEELTAAVTGWLAAREQPWLVSR